MKIVSSITVWNGSIGSRISITYSEVDETTGKIISDNNRLDRIITDHEALEASSVLKSYAQSLVDAD